MATLHHGDIASLILELAASQSQSLVQGLDLLRVLPAIEQPDTCAALLARGFVDPALAVTLGHADLLSEFPKWQLLDARVSIIQALAASGDVAALSTFVARYAGAIEHGPMTIDAIDQKTIIYAALKSGHDRVLEWLVATAAEQEWDIDWHSGMWYAPAVCGHIPVLHWALRKGYFGTHERYHNAESVYSIDHATCIPRAATEGHHIDLLEWWWAIIVPLISSPPALPPPTDLDGIINQALFSGDLEVVQWWWVKFEAYRTPSDRFGSRTAAYNALASGSPPVIQWLWDIAARPDASELLTSWDTRPLTTLPNGPFSSSLQLVQWFALQLPHGQPFRWTPHNTFVCARLGAVDVLDWVLALPDTSKVDWGDLLASHAVRYWQVHVVEWYLDHRAQLPEQQQPRVFFGDSKSDPEGMDAVVLWETQVGLVDASFVRLGADIAQHRNCDWLEWWLFQLSKPARSHLVPSALTRALISAQSVWALDRLAGTATAEYGLDILSLVMDHSCMRGASSLEAVCWWFVVLGGSNAAKDKWQSRSYGSSMRCTGCRLLDQKEL
ncbi:hypothetical protein BC828DRAFT_384178 [Blastocladiella britannica]|nr:hypothetical protein BC828DRAFT_384178 [Blastocladiella britannica]